MKETQEAFLFVSPSTHIINSDMLCNRTSAHRSACYMEIKGLLSNLAHIFCRKPHNNNALVTCRSFFYYLNQTAIYIFVRRYLMSCILYCLPLLLGIFLASDDIAITLFCLQGMETANNLLVPINYLLCYIFGSKDCT